MDLNNVFAVYVIDGYYGADALMSANTRKLLNAGEENLREQLRRQYDCSDICPALADMLLSRGGVVRREGHVQLHICGECDEALKDDRIPTFSVKMDFTSERYLTT
ncbi:hypothetical protein GQ600_4318 [Phytophthora cactorum]|nr:hypothetical protein GQ600_4318 [Phytophthora cactorum]